MSRKSRISFGPGAASLLLIVVILTMSVLGILALMNARNDSRLSEHSIEAVKAGYELSGRAERAFAALDALALECAGDAGDDEAYLRAVEQRLPQEMILIDREIWWQETDGLRTLECGATLSALDQFPRLTWTTHRLSSVTEESTSFETPGGAFFAGVEG